MHLGRGVSQVRQWRRYSQFLSTAADLGGAQARDVLGGAAVLQAFTHCRDHLALHLPSTAAVHPVGTGGGQPAGTDQGPRS